MANIRTPLVRFMTTVLILVCCLAIGTAGAVESSSNGKAESEILDQLAECVTRYFDSDLFAKGEQENALQSVGTSTLFLSNHPYIVSPESTTVWAVRTSPVDVSRRVSEAASADFPFRAFTVYIRPEDTSLIMICSDTIVNSVAPISEVQWHKDSVTLRILHQSDGTGSQVLGLSPSIPSSTFLEALTNAPELTTAQYIMAYLIQLATRPPEPERIDGL